MKNGPGYLMMSGLEDQCMPDDVVLNKVASLERCIQRIRQVYSLNDQNLYENLMAQESILLNLQRTCEVSIDLAMHVVRKRRWGVPRAGTPLNCCGPMDIWTAN